MLLLNLCIIHLLIDSTKGNYPNNPESNEEIYSEINKIIWGFYYFYKFKPQFEDTMIRNIFDQ